MTNTVSDAMTRRAKQSRKAIGELYAAVDKLMVSDPAWVEETLDRANKSKKKAA